MYKRSVPILLVLLTLLTTLVTSAAGGPPQGTQTDAAFAASYAKNAVINVSATTQKTSCYAPEVYYKGALTAADGYVDGGSSLCNGAANTGENLGPYPTQDVSN